MYIMTVRQVRGTRSYKLTNNVRDRCGGPEKSDTPNRFYWSTVKNRSYRQGRPQTQVPSACNNWKFYQLFHKPPTMAAGL